MDINYIIVQEIVKAQGVNEAHLTPNETMLPINDLAIRLTTNLNDRYNSRNINRAIFKEEDTEFSKKFKKFNEKRTSENFINFSIDAIKSLKNILENVPFATGGYFVFIDYSSQVNINYTSCFLVRNTDGLIFERDEDTGEFKISEQFHIDFEKLAVGCRVSLNAFNGDEEIKYLNFITGKNESVSGYFKNWINADQFEDEKADSHYLLQMMEELPLPSNEDGTKMTRDDFKKSVYDRIKASPNNSVDLNNLNDSYYDDDVIGKYVEQKQINISTKFKARDNILKKLVKFDANVDLIRISFPYELLSKDIVRTDQKDKDLVIIKSRNLADKIREEEN